ncbi:hypothetical protein D3C75_448830 [compost metagenome]
MSRVTNMQLVILDLQLHGRATCVEIARRTGIENPQAIGALMELDKDKKVMQLNGYWWLHSEPSPPAVKARRQKRQPQSHFLIS